MGRKGMLASRNCRDPAALCLGFLYFSLFGILYKPQMLVFDVLDTCRNPEIKFNKTFFRTLSIQFKITLFIAKTKQCTQHILSL